MNENQKEILLARIKSLTWRIAMMIGAVLVTWVLNQINALHLSVGLTTLLGLVLGEISKFLNTNAKDFK